MKSLACNAIIFDLDGVLVDSSAVINRHWQQWANQHGLEMAEIARVMHGRRAVETMQLVAPHLDVQAEAARLSAAEAADTKGLLRIEGSNQLLQALPPEAWAVATSGTRAIALARLRAAGLPVPKVLVTADDVQHGKPAPDSYLLAAEQLGAAPERCIVIEDAPAGTQAATTAGMRVIALTTSHGRESLKGAVAVVDNLLAVEFEENNHLPGDGLGRLILVIH